MVARAAPRLAARSCRDGENGHDRIGSQSIASRGGVARNRGEREKASRTTKPDADATNATHAAQNANEFSFRFGKPATAYLCPVTQTLYPSSSSPHRTVRRSPSSRVVRLVAFHEAVPEEVVAETAVDEDPFPQAAPHPVRDLVGRQQRTRHGVEVRPPVPVREGALRSAEGHDGPLVDAARSHRDAGKRGGERTERIG